MARSSVRSRLTKKRQQERSVKPADLLSSGSTLLNLACSGSPFGAFPKGKYIFLVGDSTSGKSFLSMTCLAEAHRNKSFKDYRFILDDVEGGVLFDIPRFFGEGVAQRLELRHSSTIEEFYFDTDDEIKDGRPFIKILDSMDALSSKYEGEKFQLKKTAHRKKAEAKGDYGDGKAKINASNIRPLLTPLKDSGSILIIINQTRDNIGAGPFEPQKTRSGGHALTFYATLELWSSVGQQITKAVKGKKRELGINSWIRVKKNRINGRRRTVEIPIYHSFGIDDVGSCIDFLVSEKHWAKRDSKIKAPEFDFVGTKQALIRKIEEEGMERDLQDLVGVTWNEIEEACQLKRKRRYE